MIIAITGATGFIGNELVLKHLELGNSVRVLTRKTRNLLNIPEEVQLFNVDLSGDCELLSDFVKDVDVLYHCAAEIRDESKMYHVNVKGTQNLVDAASGIIKHWVQLSSTGVYGNPENVVLNEATPTHPKNIYEVTKLQSDELVIKAGKDNKFTYTILRPSNVFGIGMKNQSLFQLIKTVDKGLFFFIGKRGSIANYISVENVINAMVLCGTMKNARGRIYIISESISMESFIGIICKALNKPLPKIRLPRFLLKFIALIGSLVPRNPLTLSRIDALSRRLEYSSQCIVQELNYIHQVSMEEGLTRLVLYYKSVIENAH